MHVDGFRFDLASRWSRELLRGRSALAVLRRRPAGPDRLAGQARSPSRGTSARPLPGRQIFTAAWTEWNGQYRDTVPRLLARRTRHARRVRVALHRVGSDLYEPATAAARSPRSTSSRARRFHARRPRGVQRQARRRQRGGHNDGESPTVVPLRRRRADRRRRGRRDPRPPATELPRHAAAVAGRADHLCTATNSAVHSRQQQHLRGGLRTLLDRLGAVVDEPLVEFVTSLTPCRR